MFRASALFVTLLSCAALGAQVTTTAKSITVQVTTTQPWTDSGLDLQSGDAVEISATGPPQPASGLSACDPKGVAGSSTETPPLPTAAPGALIARLHAQG